MAPIKIPFAIYRPVYDKLVNENKQFEFANQYKVRNINRLMNKPYLSNMMFIRLIDFKPFVNGFSTANNNGIDCNRQNKMYYDALMNLINNHSLGLTETQKSKIQQEQKRMYLRVKN